MEGNNQIVEEQKRKKRTKLIQTLIVIFVPLFILVTFFIYAATSYSPPENLYLSNTNYDANINNNINSSAENDNRNYHTGSVVTADLQSCEMLTVPENSGLQISTSSPGLRDSTADHYYKIYGNTVWDLRNQMSQCGPKQDGESFDAVTHYYINWNYLYQYQADGSCQIKNVAVGVKVDIYYPGWQKPNNPDYLVVERWNAYIKNLIVHEEGHRQIAFEGAKQIFDKLNSIPESDDCQTIENQANAESTAITNEVAVRQKSYDDATNHGETQGAFFHKNIQHSMGVECC